MDDLPKRFVIYKPDAGVVGHGVEFPDGTAVVQRRASVTVYNSLDYLLAYHTTDGETVTQYDDDPIIEEGRRLKKIAESIGFEHIESAA